MDFTSHFYRTEEVCAALVYSIGAGQKDQAFFWAQELIDSGATHLLILQLVWAYSINFSHRRLDWLISFADICLSSDIIDEERLQEAVQALLAIPAEEKDGSFILTALLEKPQKALTTPKANPHTLHVLSQPSEAWLGISHPLMTAVLKHLHWLVSTHCDLFESNLVRPNFRLLTDNRRELLDSWEAVLGRRARRIYTIPSSALYAMAARGAQPVTETTTDELRNAHNTFHLSPYWSAICPQTLRCDEDYIWENFLNKVFLQDDIPEEWSKTDQLKSHGPGLGAKPTVGGWLWRCVPREAVAAPGWFESLARRFENVAATNIQTWFVERLSQQ